LKKNSVLGILPWQAKVFLEASKKYRRIAIQKGRRLGYTYGLALFLIIEAITNRDIDQVLWGDTIASNNIRYVERYFKPILKWLERDFGVRWEYRKQASELEINGTVIDFRSADRPMNWEGFGYPIIILNEAGIILRDTYLYENAVAPMLLDNPNSLLIVGGTPKGKRWRGDLHKFYQICEMAKTDKTGLWKHFHFTTYDNPLNTKESIDEFIKTMPKSVVRQEIYGEFIDVLEATMFDCDTVHEAMAREAQPSNHVKITGIDVGWANDLTVIATRQGQQILPLIPIVPVRDDMAMAQKIAQHLYHIKPKIVFVDYGWGTGIVSYLRDMGFNVVGVFFGSKAQDPDKYANKKAEMYDALRQFIERGGVLPDDSNLAKELCSVLIEPDSRGRLKIISKGDTEGESPNRVDACSLTFAGNFYAGGNESAYDIPSIGTW